MKVSGRCSSSRASRSRGSPVDQRRARPGWLSVNALLFQKMLLNSAVGWRSRPVARRVLRRSRDRLPQRVVAPRRRDRPRAGCRPSPRTTGRDVVGHGVVDDRTFEESSSMIAPPMSAAPLSTIMLFRMLTGGRARRGRRSRRRRRRSSCSGSGCGRRRPRRCRHRATAADRQLGLDGEAGARVHRVVVVDLVVVDPPAGAEPDVRDAGAVVDAEVGADDAAADVVAVGAVEDPDAAGLGEAAVADQPVVRDPTL